jgi:hypothetical protein
MNAILGTTRCKITCDDQLLPSIAVNQNNFIIPVKVSFSHKETDRLLPKTSAVVRAPYAGCT